MTRLRLGFDLDNTIIRYDKLFARLAAARGWIAADEVISKTALRESLIREDGHDARWQELQAEAYGPRLSEAEAFTGCLAFFDQALRAGHELFIVSHKSETSHLRPEIHLRESAIRWLRENIPALHPDHVVFADTREQKVNALTALKLDVFVDDLAAVLNHSDFPVSTERVHFAPDSEETSHRSQTSARSWADIASCVGILSLTGVPAYRAIVSNFGRAPARVSPAASGGNNRTLKVILNDGRAIVLKRYWIDGRDPRKRAEAEHRALSLLWDSGLRCIAQPFYVDPSGEFALMSCLDGRPLSPSELNEDHIAQAVDFLHRLDVLHRNGPAHDFPEGADSRRCLGDYRTMIEKRLSRVEHGVESLTNNRVFKDFLNQELLPASQMILARFEAKVRAAGLDLKTLFSDDERTLSPSDFGFHNALVDAEGRLSFLDFEYFGVDDPAKLAADFTHSVAQTVPARLKRLFTERFAAGLERPKSFFARLALVDELIALEWVLIVLNVLSPESLARRRFAGNEQDDRDLLSARLEKARTLLQTLRREKEPELVEARP